jgi:uncharacterized protein YbjT (DUF2867 family)
VGVPILTAEPSHRTPGPSDPGTSPPRQSLLELVGPDEMTGTRTAAIWSRALGRPVSYAGNDLDAWEKQSLQFMPDWMVYDFRMMFEFFQKNGLEASTEAISRQTRLLGHPPRSFETFAAETAAAWK